MANEDPLLAELMAEVRADPETLGLLLHGSRAVGTHRPDSDFDLIRIVTERAYAVRKERGTLLERSAADALKADVLYQALSRIESYVTDPGWYTPTYVSARVLFDRTGEIAGVLARITAEAGRIASERTAANYDEYLNCFVRSIKAARRGDVIGRQLHSAESALALIRLLFGLESNWPPYHDNLAGHLIEVEEAQGWPPGYLADALLQLVRDADPTFQQELEGLVEHLMSSRDIQHEWGDDLEPLKALEFTAGRVKQ